MPGRSKQRPARGFIMMFTLVAVALAGLVMVETAPDFSNYAVLAKGEEFDHNLSEIRRITAVHPFCVTTCDKLDPASTGVIIADDLLNCLSQFVAADNDTVSSSRQVITTIPRDPNIPARNWLSGSAAQRKFWAASYNAVRNPSFFTGAREEAMLDSALRLLVVEADGPGQRVKRTDRFGFSAETVCYITGQKEILNCELSPDGSSICFDSNGLGGRDIYTVGTETFAPYWVTDNNRDTPPNSRRWDKPTWSADGSLLAFRQWNGTRWDIIVSKPFKNDISQPLSHGAVLVTSGTPAYTYLDGLSFSPPYPGKDYLNRSRYLAYIYSTGGSRYLGLYDFKLNKHIFHEDGSGFAVSGDNPCMKPKWRRYGSGGEALLYQSATNNNVWMITSPGQYSKEGYPDPTENLDTGIPTPLEIFVLPIETSLRGSQNTIIYQDRSNSLVYRASIEPCVGQPGYAAKPPRMQIDIPVLPVPGSLAMSERGTMLAFIDGSGDPWKDVYTMSSDGTNLRLVVDHDGAKPDIHQVLFSATRHSWVGPAPYNARHLNSNAKLVDARDGRVRIYYDADDWRAFIRENSDYPGDYKFPTSWLRLIPPENENQILFDDSDNIWRVSAEHPKVAPDGNSNFFMSKIDPDWTWNGGSYVAKEAHDLTGGEPADLFKQSFRVATTVIVGKGYGPSISPNDEIFCSSMRVSEVSTYPPDTTTDPIDDMDLFIGNTGGAPEPPLRDITPDTITSAESRPSFSADGRYIYYQMEEQPFNPGFLQEHRSSICRVTVDGGVAQMIQECGHPVAEWSQGWKSNMEFYAPSASPDGTRVAFIGKERYTGASTWPHAAGEPDDGDIITECVYVKDVLFRREPVLLLRTVHPYLAANVGGNYNPHGSYLNDYSIDSLSWTPDGEEIIVNLTKPMNTRFPARINERGSPYLPGDKPYYEISTEQMVVAVPCSISHFDTSGMGQNAVEFSTGNIDPPGDNFRILLLSDRYIHNAANPKSSAETEAVTATNKYMPNWPAHTASTKRMIFNAMYSRGAYAFQRLVTDSAFFNNFGFSPGIWYVLSGFVRTSLAVEDLHSAQMMIQLYNSRGTLIAFSNDPANLVYQVGYPDIGGTEWTRFSAAIQFDTSTHQPEGKDRAPFYINLMLYTRGNHGSWAEFTGLKLERAYDIQSKRPTRFNPGWILFSSSLDPDPRHPGYLLFER